jgi:hypothetical protein
VAKVYRRQIDCSVLTDERWIMGGFRTGRCQHPDNNFYLSRFDAKLNLSPFALVSAFLR